MIHYCTCTTRSDFIFFLTEVHVKNIKLIQINEGYFFIFLIGQSSFLIKTPKIYVLLKSYVLQKLQAAHTTADVCRILG
uniref:Uncharacterized protein n=1 Tax=Nelumbo nucifera TaxID=4432 RepID=A0A822Z9F5_NELNU|nr:TPA_asm: hypothetical protein HUJ06_014009 [Nelumbo nucifera]